MLLALVALARLERPARGATGNPAKGEFEGVRQYRGKDGQEHDIEEPSKRSRSVARNALKAGKANSKEEQLAVEQLLQYDVHALTWSENVAKLPDLRAALKKQLADLGKAPLADLHDELNQMALKICGEAAADDRYPMAVRLNCILMIGELDAKESSVFPRVVVPLPEARKLLVDVVADDKQPVQLRLAAVRGLRRNILAGLSADEQNTVAESLLDVIRAPLDPKKDSIVTLWLRLLAIDGMHLLTSKGLKADQQAIAAALSSMIADVQIPTWMRCQAAGELAGIEAGQFAPKEVVQDVQALANLVVAMSAANPFTKIARQAALEREAAEQAEVANSRTRRRGAADDEKEEPKDDGKDKEDDEPALPLTKPMRDVAVHAMLYDLGRVRKGLMGREPGKKGEPPHSTTHGLFAAAGAEAQKTITVLVTHIDAMIAELAKLNDKKDVDKEAVAEAALAIADSGRQLAETLSEQPAAPESSEPAPEPEKSVAKPAPSVRRGQPSGNAPARESAVGSP
ncbi:MAG TPA: hypothetical protein VFW87_09165 [Pirellulales bacterium]|nr:hypothetical protein [Pirellulales bacterium]